MAWAVPPAARMGPLKNTDRYSVPSGLGLILTPAMPTMGATSMPSVSTDSPTRTARSMAISLPSLAATASLASSLAMKRESSSRLSMRLDSSLMRSATPSTCQSESCFSTRAARSSA
ncbi:MAG: hypothetical protein A4E30_01690 [Methanomassiliicoccales archaeon PtaB.Bin215]|nr:MAG: hypothetical protein A4E30_01690 [Methanomassiliicoccales archaeon PtaB.Bin215]